MSPTFALWRLSVRRMAVHSFASSMLLRTRIDGRIAAANGKTVAGSQKVGF
jgi:hypothetical protein